MRHALCVTSITSSTAIGGRAMRVDVMDILQHRLSTHIACRRERIRKVRFELLKPWRIRAIPPAGNVESEVYGVDCGWVTLVFGSEEAKLPRTHPNVSLRPPSNRHGRIAAEFSSPPVDGGRVARRREEFSAYRVHHPGSCGGPGRT